MARKDIRTRLSSRGRWALKLGLLFFVLGLLKLDLVLLQLSLFLLFLLPLSDYLAHRNLRGLKFERDMPDRPTARKPFNAVLRLHNTNRFFQRFTLALDDHLLTSDTRNWMVDALPAGQAAEVSRRTHMPRRGRYSSGRVTIRSNFPFGLVHAERVWDEAVDMVVYPAPLYPNRAQQSRGEPVHDLESSVPHLPLDTGEFRGLRPFRSGDRIRSIHWPASARRELRHGGGGSALMVREFDPPLGNVHSFVFHSFTPHGNLPNPQAFERCMQLLCGFFRECHQRGVPFEFTASFNHWQTMEVRTGPDLQAALELIACASPRTERNPMRLVERIARHSQRGRCFVVSNVPLEQWAGLLQQLEVPVDCVDAYAWRSREAMGELGVGASANRTPRRRRW